MRQIGDQWRPAQTEDEVKPYNLGLDRPLTQDEETRADNYYTFRYKSLFNNLCMEKFFSNSTKDFIQNFNRCTEKMHQVQSIFSSVKSTYTNEVELYKQSGLNNLKY
jgi:hypothetical protein